MDVAEALTIQNQRLDEAEDILRALDQHPRADYPRSLDRRIKAWLKKTVKG